ncbi:MAG: hypothetical protein V2A79_19310 [Planctomycetota bacterium]
MSAVEAPPSVEKAPVLPSIRQTAVAWWCSECDHSQTFKFTTCQKCGRKKG